MGFWAKIKKFLVGEASSETTSKAKTHSQGTQQSVVGTQPQTAALAGKGYHRVQIHAGPRGWGGPLVIAPRKGRHLIYSVTGGGIHPVAQRIADLTGGIPFDGFRSKASFDEIAVAVIDCGGTARVGVYPMKKVLTVDVHPTSPAGPLMKFITADLFVSGVGINDVSLLND